MRNGMIAAALFAVQCLGQGGDCRLSHEKLHTTLWVMTAPEYRGVTLGIFRTARDRLDAALKNRKWTAAVEQQGRFDKLPPAVILDVDETVLDNSGYNVRIIGLQRSWDGATWSRWVEEARAPAIPGAVEFTQYARRRGVQVFFVTNREAELEAATRRNLEREGFPLDAKIDTVYTKGEKPGWTSDKSVRRREIAARYRILLLCGDDLGDFLGGIAVPPAGRQALAARYDGNWGTKWIILPNAHYGSWEDALYGFDRKLDDAVILRKKYEALNRQ